jgi:SAM-dependent methyltransferase
MKTITAQKDPLGTAIVNFFETGKNTDIIVESDIADDDIIPSEYFFRSYEQMPQIEKDALKLCKGKVLDVGAAAGCHSLYLQDKGIDVTAIEISELCCQAMKQRGVKNVITGNFFNYSEDIYDTILLLMNGIGIAGSLTGLEILLMKANQLLKKGGSIIFDSSDIDYMYYDEDGSKLINLNSAYYGELSYRMRYKSIIGDLFQWLFIDFDTLAPIAKNMGFNPKLLKKGDHFDYLGILKKC